MSTPSVEADLHNPALPFFGHPTVICPVRNPQESERADNSVSHRNGSRRSSPEHLQSAHGRIAFLGVPRFDPEEAQDAVVKITWCACERRLAVSPHFRP
jgi:hypothetical protein